MAVCKSCKAPVVWTITEQGKRMPAEPKDGGNLVLERLENGDFESRVVAVGAGTHQSHFVSCPQSRSWRKGDKKHE